jgi:hypothetical protein
MAATGSWDVLRAQARRLPGLRQPRPGAGCVVCRGPVRAGYVRCYQCARHAWAGGALLSDAVVPVAYAVRGTPFAEILWRYKSTRPVPGAALLALLLAFLHDHGGCVWRQAGPRAPDRLAVVPSGCGRPGEHPLARLVAPYLDLPQVRLVLCPGEQGRDLNINRFRAGPVPGRNVLLLDDTWVSGASAQSAAAALKLAGAAHVTTVVLARYINLVDPRAVEFPGTPYRPGACPVDGAHRLTAEIPPH